MPDDHPGSGEAFHKLEGELSADPDVKDPAALAASIGRKKYGKGRFQKMAERARARKEKREAHAD